MAKKIAVVYGGFPMCGKDTQTSPMKKLGELVFETGPELKRLAEKNPHDARYEPIRQGHLVSDEITLWTVKKWVVEQITRKPQHQRLHLNGVPRRSGQFEIVTWLFDRGYDVKCIWFTTPPSVCQKRTRPDRFEDVNPVIMANRARVYTEETQPIIELMAKHGVSTHHGTMLDIDNTHLPKEETARRIISFLDLPFAVPHMFPAEQQASLVENSSHHQRTHPVSVN